MALARMGLRPSEARALEVAEYRDEHLVIDQKCTGPNRDNPVKPGTKSGKAKTLPVPVDLAAWVDSHVPSEARLERRRLLWSHQPGAHGRTGAFSTVGEKVCHMAGVFGVSLYPGTKHSMTTDALRRGVSERALQAFLGHADPRSARRYARLADTALVSVLRKGDPKAGASQARKLKTRKSVE